MLKVKYERSTENDMPLRDITPGTIFSGRFGVAGSDSTWLRLNTGIIRIVADVYGTGFFYFEDAQDKSEVVRNYRELDATLEIKPS